MADTDTDDPADTKATPDAKKKAAQRQKILVGVGVVGLILTYVLIRRSSASTSSPSSTPATPYGAYNPGSFAGGGYYGSGDYSATQLQTLQNTDATLATDLSALSTEMSNLQAAVTAIPAQQAASAPAAQAAATNQGYGQITVGSDTYDLLGIETNKGPQGYSGYNVSGGAPVFFLAPGSSTPAQGVAQAVPGAKVLVPSIYGPNISTTPNHPAAAA